ncbi:tetratricopeptide repeat protein [Streptomyces sp. NPDC021356]|uniref:tetratricopeptide repeat protein n=1 Tax=Streptomyces sp. NPDC021356 TaxID=3154900 RepID=UPI00340AB281
MYRLSREKKREHKRAVRSAAATATPIAVHVPPSGPVDTAGGSAWASVGGVRVDSAPGEEIQQAVLNHLHRIALTTGRPVLATVTDERIGYVVPLRVHGDGSSTFTAQPLRTTPPEPGHGPQPSPGARAAQPPKPEEPRGPGGPQPDSVTHVLRQVPQPSRGPAAPQPSPEPVEPPQPPQAVPAVRSSAAPAPAFVPRSEPAPTDDGRDDGTAQPSPATPPGTAAAPTGSFGPPPVMDAGPPAAAGLRPAAPNPAPLPAEPAPLPVSAPVSRPTPAIDPAAVVDLDPDPKPAPARGFDAVAEAVLGDDPRTLAGEGGAVLLAEPLAQVNEAVRAGRIDEAATLAERTVTEASATLGATHPEVLRVRELSAYIAYLAGDPLRAFVLSLDLARIHLGAGDAEGAYGDVRSAATAWRAVRDPEEGLRLGDELLGLWTELAAEDGPATEDVDQLESARARMDRLTERARRQAASGQAD